MSTSETMQIISIVRANLKLNFQIFEHPKNYLTISFFNTIQGWILVAWAGVNPLQSVWINLEKIIENENNLKIKRGDGRNYLQNSFG